MTLGMIKTLTQFHRTLIWLTTSYMYMYTCMAIVRLAICGQWNKYSVHVGECSLHVHCIPSTGNKM